MLALMLGICFRLTLRGRFFLYYFTYIYGRNFIQGCGPRYRLSVFRDPKKGIDIYLHVVKNSSLNSFQSFKNGKAMFSASFIRRSDVSSFPLGDRGNDTSGQGQALLRCDNDDGGVDDDENSDVGNDFHCGSYDDSIDVWCHLG